MQPNRRGGKRLLLAARRISVTLVVGLSWNRLLNVASGPWACSSVPRIWSPGKGQPHTQGPGGQGGRIERASGGGVAQNGFSRLDTPRLGVLSPGFPEGCAGGFDSLS
jgi:hypothetical protein